MIAAVVYLAAIVAANVSVSLFGPGIAPLNALILIGLDLTLRDRIHDRFGPGRVMLGLILAGGVLSWVLNAGAVAVASTAAFLAASGVDAAVYELLRDRPRLLRINVSNVLAAAVDSVVFGYLLVGYLDPYLTGALWLAKVLGGFVWSLILAIPLGRSHGRPTRHAHASHGSDSRTDANVGG